ncbi:Serine/alanine racemase [Andreprevotia sp. IGB-42]|uniref:acyltransferase family protein n=1 Tax=Andreprevotia sp. IGB-42 TaxID=2497473 RepID=UPI00135CB189|nr:acyltransferase family protein [Andreprevotia sp. IGB-42]KAF0815395.1 Serine/alanine racemase [Andreprevotia sp. IGB-42]
MAAPARNLTLDLLKVLLALMVVGLHAGLLTDSAPELGQLLVQGLFRIAVPSFFIANGYYFAAWLTRGKPISKWLLRILVLYAVWMVIYAPLYLRAFWKSGDTLDLLTDLVFGYRHLWYLPAMLLAGLLLHMLRGASVKRIAALSSVLFVCGLLLQNSWRFAAEAPGLAALPADLYRNGLFFGLPFFAAGYCLARADALATLARGYWAALALAGVVLMLLESDMDYRLLPPGMGLDLQLGLPAASIGLFMWANQSLAKTSTDLWSRLSAAIYFIHPLCLTVLLGVHHFKSTVLTALGVAMSLLCSVVLLRVNQRWPVFL